MKALAFGQTQFDRASIPDSLRDLSAWPSVDETAISNEDDKATFRARREAIRVFVEEPNTSLLEIHRRTGVHPRALYRLLYRCLSKHDDGRIYGFRGAIPYVRLKQYERNQPVSASQTNGGLSGAFNHLVQRHPSIATLLKRTAKAHGKKTGGKREGRRALARIHKEFLDECRAVGIKAGEYPFTQSLLAIRSLSAYLKKLSEETFEGAAKAAGARKVKPAISEAEDPVSPAARPFEVVEFDGHKIDLRIKVRVQDPFGLETTLEMNRIWILVLLDIVTRAVIGYALALGKEYNKDDVAAALQNALTPYRPRQFKIPTLSIRNGGGFPSGVIPATEYACWDWFRFDGARSHIAADSLERLTQIVGCWPDNGPAGEPDERPFVERFFHLVAAHFAHRLPGTTGSNPKAIEKLLNDPGSDVALMVELEELEEMIEVLLADYNGESHGGLGGRTPLEAMHFHVQKQRGFLRTLPSALRSNLCLLQEARTVPIRGKLVAGVRPHINFAGVRYTSTVLSNNPALIGKSLRIYFDVRDIRVVKAFFEDGSELGILTAAKPWCYTPHSLRVRQEILRLKREGKLKYKDGDDPVEAWYKYKRGQAKTSKRAAGELAKHQSYKKQLAATEAPTPIPEPLDTVAPAVTETRAPSKPESPPQPRALRIKRTLTF
jgi:putative transposase